MVTTPKSTKPIIVIAGVGMGIAIIIEAMWLLLAHLAFGNWGVWIVEIRTVILCGFCLSLAVYRKWPWVASVVSWVDLMLIVLKIIPWNVKPSGSFVHQFMSDLIFFASATAGLIAYLYDRKCVIRRETESDVRL